MKTWIVAIVMLWLVQKPGFAQDKPRFELLDGDRVVLIGGTMIERDQTYGYLETRLTRRYPDRNITFRNLGWSGDTVEGISRAGFGPPSDGFKQLVDHVLALKPTVLIIGYGANESFEGKAGLPKFVAGLEKLLKAIEPTKARLVFLSPTRQENLGPPLPDPTAHNADLALYRDAIKLEAAKRGAFFVDLFALLADEANTTPRRPLTNNGLHFTPYGYWKVAEAIEQGLGLAPAIDWRGVGRNLGEGPGGIMVMIEFPTKIAELSEISKGIRFRFDDEVLPLPLSPGEQIKLFMTFPTPPGVINARGVELPKTATIVNRYQDGSMIGRLFTVAGMKVGRYQLKVDGKPIETVTFPTIPDEITGGFLVRSVEFNQVEALRQAINAKNELYFYRWRPQNETYLFGFRKHEQGQNAREIPLFDPLVAAKEAEIAKLRVPVPHVYELIREGEVGQ